MSLEDLGTWVDGVLVEPSAAFAELQAAAAAPPVEEPDRLDVIEGKVDEHDQILTALIGGNDEQG